MASEGSTNPLAFKIALINLVVGGLALLASVLYTSLTSGFSQLSLGLLLLGGGEYLNNPIYHQQTPDNKTREHQSFWNRQRNVCALGNLLDIAGLIMIAIGVATLLF